MRASSLNIKFQEASLDHRGYVLQWLEEPHVKEFWDNSPEHREDILLFMKGRKEPSPYWDGIFDYWIGLINDEPYCLLMTSEILLSQSDLPAVWRTHLSKVGRTYSIDFMIGNRKYLGHGLGGPTLEDFTQFIREAVDPSIDTFFIDPADSNPRAKHVYEKGGFKRVATFYRDFQDEKNVKHYLMVKNFETLKALPAPTGPYRIGTVKYDLVDIYRKELEFTEGRLIPIQIYFPMDRGVHTLDQKIFEERAPGPWGPLHVLVHSHIADLSLLAGDQHPVIFLNHASAVAMTDYAFLAEDLSSHGYVVISIQHDLRSDKEEPSFWQGSSCSRNAKVVDNLLYVFEWLKTTQATFFSRKLDLNRIGFIGHSLGANSLLLWANRTIDSFYPDTRPALLSRIDQKNVRECLILLDATRFSSSFSNRYPLFFLFSEERDEYHKNTGCYDEMIRAGHQVKYYKGTTHISFMDHGCICPSETYFKGNPEERITFFNEIRKDIREFLKQQLGSN